MKPIDTFSLATAAILLVGAASCKSTSSSAAPVPVIPVPGAYEITYRGDFHAPMGVQLWSFREEAKKDPGAMLRMTRHMGITHVETAGLYGMTATQFADALRNAGLTATSMHVSYEDLTKNPETVIANAKALGARYVGLAWSPHDAAFKKPDARRPTAASHPI